MAATYMGTTPKPNANARGLKLPKLELGQYTLNVVMQSSICCGTNIENEGADLPGGLVMAGQETLTSTQKRVGVLGTNEDSGVGLHRMGQFQGDMGPLDKRPQILGFVSKEGKLTTYRNGVKIGERPAYSTARTTLGWINGWLDAETESRGQLAEVKLYKRAYSESVMRRLHDLLECKWGVSNAQGDEWKTCEMAQGEGGNPGSGIPGGVLRIGLSGTYANGQGTAEMTTDTGIDVTTPTQEILEDPYSRVLITDPIPRNGDNVFEFAASTVINQHWERDGCIGNDYSHRPAYIYLQHNKTSNFVITSFDGPAGSSLVEVGHDDLIPYGCTWPPTSEPPCNLQNLVSFIPDMEPTAFDTCVDRNATGETTLELIHVEGYFEDEIGRRDYVTFSVEGSRTTTSVDTIGFPLGHCDCDAP